MAINLSLGSSADFTGGVLEADSAYASFEDQDFIARGMFKYDMCDPFPETKQLSFKPWDRELDLMARAEGITALSSTLLRKNCAVDVYTPSGLLFNRARVDITHVFKADANTCLASSAAGDDEVLGSIELSCRDLQELKDFIDADPQASKRQGMNELKIDSKLDGLIGLYFLVSGKKNDQYHLAKLTMFVWKKHIRDKYQLNLPVYEYCREGVLTRLDESELSKLPPVLSGRSQHDSQQYRLLKQFV